jgi:glycine betaine/choline ABC-type transport system substrate-binding protein
MRQLRTAVAVATVALAVAAATAAAQAPRLAAPADCRANPNCAPGLAAVYGFDVQSVLVPLNVADAGIAALDDGIAEVAVAFSTDPQVSRPDIRTLEDDRGLVGEDKVVPTVRRELLRAHGPRLRMRLNAVSRLITTLTLRSLNQQLIDGRLPEAVGGEFADANGLGTRRARRPGMRIVIGHQDFGEAETIAHVYGAALRAAGYRIVVRSVHGFRPEAVRLLRRGAINLYIAYARSLTEYLRPDGQITGDRVLPPLRRALKPLRARPLALAPGENRNLFVMKAATAQALGIARLSDLARYWPPA